MYQYRKVDKIRLAQTNKYNVLHCLIHKGPINRAAIAKLTDLSIPSVMSIIDDLFEKRVIRSMGKGESSGGKPPEMLEIDPEWFYYIGVDIGRTTIRIVVNNAVAHEAACLQEPTGDPIPEGLFVDRLNQLILKIVEPLGAGRKRILGIGVAMPGLIENETGNVLFSPDFGWHNIPLKNWMQEALPFPVLVENANRALALNESNFLNHEEQAHTTFVVNLGYGIGAALVEGESLYLGASGTSGEIGHIMVDPQGPHCKCGKTGCLEALASGEAIAREARECIQSGRLDIESFGGIDPSEIDARMVFAAAEGNAAARQIIEKAAEYIGIGLSMAINVLDPDRLILCGGLMKNGPFFLNLIKAGIEKYKMPLASPCLVISTGTESEFSTANGASRIFENKLWWQRALPV
jgi:predicted NBD/HSP70 family sugar kinase